MFIYLNETAVFVLFFIYFLIHPKAIQWKNFSNVDWGMFSWFQRVAFASTVQLINAYCRLVLTSTLQTGGHGWILTGKLSVCGSFYGLLLQFAVSTKRVHNLVNLLWWEKCIKGLSERLISFIFEIRYIFFAFLWCAYLWWICT